MTSERVCVRAAGLAAGLLAAVVWLPAGCSDEEGDGGKPGGKAGKAAKGTGGMTLWSTAFDHGEAIPAKHSYNGDNVSPALRWSNVPSGTKSLVLIVDDPDANGFTHWLVYNIPPTATGLKEDVPAGETLSDPAGAMQGTSDGPGDKGYCGMDPPPNETHHYHFTLYALDTTIDVGPGPDKEKLSHMIEGHELAKTTLIGTYKR
jgi:hypothetical protein